MTFKVNSSVSCDFPEGCSAFIACDHANAYRESQAAGWKRVRTGPTTGRKHLDLCPTHANACEKCQGAPPKGFTCNACEVSG